LIEKKIGNCDKQIKSYFTYLIVFLKQDNQTFLIFATYFTLNVCL